MQIHELQNSTSVFASDDFLMVSGPTNNTRKMSKDAVLEQTATNTLKNNIAPEFDSTVAYTKGQFVTYQGKIYQFTSDHSAGAWNASHATVSGQSALLKMTAQNALAGNIAEEFSTETTYAIDDLVIYQGQLYRCTTTHTGAWASRHFTATDADTEMAKTKAMVAGFTERSSKNPYAINDEFEYQGKVYKVLEGFYGAFDASKVCELPLAEVLISKVTGKNILHFRNAIRGYYMNYEGTLVANEKMLVTDYIPVQPSTQYRLSARNKASGSYTYPATTQSPRIFFYNSNLTSAGTNIYTQSTFTTTETTAFIRISLNYVDFVEIQLEKGSARTKYEPYTSMYSEFEGEFLNEKLTPKVEKLEGINVFDASQPFVQNKYLESDGNESKLANFRISPYIPVEPLTDYVVYGVKSGAIVKPGQNSTSLYACFYGESKNFLSSTLASTYYYHTPENAKYMRVSFYSGEWSSYMAYKGTYLLPYQPYNVIYGYINDLGIIDEHLKGSRLPPAIRKACICIMSDDGVVSADSRFADILKRHKLTCGFAVDPNAGSFKQDFNTYRMLCRQGFSVHNHYGQPLNNYANETAARKAIATYQNILTDNGLPVNSFVCPGNLYIDDYRSMLGGLFAYVFGTGGVAHNTPSSDVLKLGRYSIETCTLEEVTTYIDAAVANGEMICLFNHSYNIGGTGYNDEAFYDSLCSYIKGLSNDGLVYFGNPDECVKFYYELH